MVDWLECSRYWNCLLAVVAVGFRGVTFSLDLAAALWTVWFLVSELDLLLQSMESRFLISIRVDESRVKFLHRVLNLFAVDFFGFLEQSSICFCFQNGVPVEFSYRFFGDQHDLRVETEVPVLLCLHEYLPFCRDLDVVRITPFIRCDEPVAFFFRKEFFQVFRELIVQRFNVGG